jgi:hypothetical protein
MQVTLRVIGQCFLLYLSAIPQLAYILAPSRGFDLYLICSGRRQVFGKLGGWQVVVFDMVVVRQDKRKKGWAGKRSHQQISQSLSLGVATLNHA